MKRRISLAFIGAVIVLAGCSTYYTAGDYFYIRNSGADMPVWVNGNSESDTIILFLHGGPGGNSSTASLFPAFVDLESRYLIAYWDQRASGLSQGNPSLETYTLDQFIEDTDLVVDVLLERYAPETFVVFGHSWGGALAAAYLDNSARADKTDGFVMHNAGYNLKDGLPSSGRWMREYAQRRIDAGTDVVRWTDLRDWLDTDPDFTVVENYRRLAMSYSVPELTDAYYFDAENKGIAGPDASFIFTSFASLAILTGGGSIRQNFNILELDLSNNLTRISIPALILWGRHDGVNTIEMGELAFDLLGTDATEKSFVVFEESGHQPFVEEPELFVNEFVAFVEGL